MKFLIVEARFYDALADALLAGAKAALDEAGVGYDIISVPGALEIPPAIAMATKSGGYDGVIALGCVIRGETKHFDIVATESARGVMDLGVMRGIAIGNGILTVETESQAWERVDKGGEAATAALSLAQIAKQYNNDRV